MKRMHLANTKSNIIDKNGGDIFVELIPGLEGIFNKQIKESQVFGKAFCDYIKDTFECRGFISSDELPQYGISNREREVIFESMGKKEGDGNLLIIYAYKKQLAKKINKRIREMLENTSHRPSIFIPPIQYETRHNLLKIFKNVS